MAVIFAAGRRDGACSSHDYCIATLLHESLGRVLFVRRICVVRDSRVEIIRTDLVSCGGESDQVAVLLKVHIPGEGSPACETHLSGLTQACAHRSCSYATGDSLVLWVNPYCKALARRAVRSTTALLAFMLHRTGEQNNWPGCHLGKNIIRAALLSLPC